MRLLYRVVLFDLDGTLIESGPGIIAAASAVLREMGLAVPERSVMMKMIGPPLADCFRRVLGVPEERVMEAVDIYHRTAKVVGLDLIKPYPGITELLSELSTLGARVGVVTSKVTPTAAEHLERYGLAPYISYLRGGVVGGSADKLFLLRTAMEELGAPAKDIVMVGDRHFDLVAAKEAGVASIGVTYGYGSAEEIAACEPTFIASSASELRAILIGQ